MTSLPILRIRRSGSEVRGFSSMTSAPKICPVTTVPIILIDKYLSSLTVDIPFASSRDPRVLLRCGAAYFRVLLNTFKKGTGKF